MDAKFFSFSKKIILKIEELKNEQLDINEFCDELLNIMKSVVYRENPTNLFINVNQNEEKLSFKANTGELQYLLTNDEWLSNLIV